jgi:hypothetical protein
MLTIGRVKLVPLLAAAAVLAILLVAILSSRRPSLLRKEPADLMAMSVPNPSIADSAPRPAAPAQYSAAPPLAIEPPAPPERTGVDMAAMAPVAVSIPRLAYAYRLGFRLSGDRIAETQERHRALCERMGVARCQLLALARGAGDDAENQARLKLRVASAEAQRFSATLIGVVAAAGGRAIQTSVTAEDVSKEIVDAEARIRQRELLVSRLTDILRSRRGTVSELVEAERSVAQAQEELDQTKGWLTELRGRVAMSDFEVTYSASVPSATPRQTEYTLWESAAGSGATFLVALRAFVTVLIYLLPWALLAIPLTLIYRRARRRWPKVAEQTVPEVAGPDDA